MQVHVLRGTTSIGACDNNTPTQQTSDLSFWLMDAVRYTKIHDLNADNLYSLTTRRRRARLLFKTWNPRFEVHPPAQGGAVYRIFGCLAPNGSSLCENLYDFDYFY
jgi:hypothetical protein